MFPAPWVTFVGLLRCRYPRPDHGSQTGIDPGSLIRSRYQRTTRSSSTGIDPGSLIPSRYRRTTCTSSTGIDPGGFIRIDTGERRVPRQRVSNARPTNNEGLPTVAGVAGNRHTPDHMTQMVASRAVVGGQATLCVCNRPGPAGPSCPDHNAGPSSPSTGSKASPARSWSSGSEPCRAPGCARCVRRSRSLSTAANPATRTISVMPTTPPANAFGTTHPMSRDPTADDPTQATLACDVTSHRTLDPCA